MLNALPKAWFAGERRPGRPRHALFLAIRDLWVGLNAGAFLVAVWYSTLPPVDGTHPGFLVAFVWNFLLFPGVVAMVAALALFGVVPRRL